ncbi:MAG: hypothetical protein RLZZ524_2921 [Pseudomonadota bacterium]|jgi:hypothetical protein
MIPLARLHAAGADVSGPHAHAWERNPRVQAGEASVLEHIATLNADLERRIVPADLTAVLVRCDSTTRHALADGRHLDLDPGLRARAAAGRLITERAHATVLRALAPAPVCPPTAAPPAPAPEPTMHPIIAKIDAKRGDTPYTETAKAIGISVGVIYDLKNGKPITARTQDAIDRWLAGESAPAAPAEPRAPKPKPAQTSDPRKPPVNRAEARRSLLIDAAICLLQAGQVAAAILILEPLACPDA